MIVAKMRGFKPDLWTDEDFVEVSAFARLLWMGMWNYACDNGHLADRSKQIKMRILPTDDVNCADLLRELAEQGLIVREDGWITVPNLTHHQKPNKRYFTTCEKPECDHPERETPGAQRGTKLHKGKQGITPGDGDGDGDGDGESVRKRPRRRLPANWKPTRDHEKRALDNDLILGREVDRFRLHAEEHDRLAVNWNAAFTKWLNKAIEFAERDRPKVTQLPHASQIESAPSGMTDAEADAWEAQQRARWSS